MTSTVYYSRRTEKYPNPIIETIVLDKDAKKMPQYEIEMEIRKDKNIDENDKLAFLMSSND